MSIKYNNQLFSLLLLNSVGVIIWWWHDVRRRAEPKELTCAFIGCGCCCAAAAAAVYYMASAAMYAGSTHERWGGVRYLSSLLDCCIEPCVLCVPDRLWLAPTRLNGIGHIFFPFFLSSPMCVLYCVWCVLIFFFFTADQLAHHILLSSSSLE